MFTCSISNWGLGTSISSSIDIFDEPDKNSEFERGSPLFSAIVTNSINSELLAVFSDSNMYSFGKRRISGIRIGEFSSSNGSIKGKDSDKFSLTKVAVPCRNVSKI